MQFAIVGSCLQQSLFTFKNIATMASSSIFKNIDSMNTLQVRQFLNSFDTVLTDCDGVLWNGPCPLDGSVEAIQGLRNLGKRIIFVTNNGTRTRKDVLDKCIKLGFGGEIKDVFTSSYLCGRYLMQKNFKQKVYIFGPKGLRSELDDVGVRYIGSGPEYSSEVRCSVEGQGLVVKGLPRPDPEVGAVIISFTLDTPFNFERIVEVAQYLNQSTNDNEMPFILSDPDPVIPAFNEETQERIKVPGAGSFAAAIEAVVKRSPILVGKPSPFAFEAISKDNPEVNPNRTIMIGDNPATDILFGNSCNLKTLMVGSGVGTLEQIQAYQKSNNEKSGLVPDYFAASLKILIPHIQEMNINN